MIKLVTLYVYKSILFTRAKFNILTQAD